MDQKQIQDKLERIQREVNQVIRGKENVVERVLAAIISGGHILMEDIPGVGKTTLATTFAKALSMNYKRVQFTPDVLPSDILGFSMYDAGSRQFVYRPGAVFCNLFLADEINRTSPKTQSALLEVMEENHATVDGVTRPLPESLCGHRNRKSTGIIRNADAAGISAGSFYDLCIYGVSGTSGCCGDIEGRISRSVIQSSAGIVGRRVVCASQHIGNDLCA